MIAEVKAPRPRGRPRLNSDSAKELDKLDDQFQAFDKQVKDLTNDRMNAAPLQEVEAQTKLSQEDIAKSKEIYLKPKRSLGPGVEPKSGKRELFNEKFREDWNYSKEFVQFIAEHREIIGEIIETWTKPFPGVNTEYWEVPTNKPVWGPRYLAEQIRRKVYHRLIMDNRPTEVMGTGTMYGGLVVDKTIARLTAEPVSTRKSIFMGDRAFK